MKKVDFMSLIKKNEIFLLEEIVKKNFSSKYKDSTLGIFWTILSPLLMMGLFTIVFSTLFGQDIKNYPVYFLCGWCIYQFFNVTITASMTSLKNNKNILQRTPAPKHIFVLGSILSEFLNYLIMFIILIGVMIVTHAQFYFPAIIFSIVPIISLLIMITGLGLILSVACVYYSDIQHLWSVLSLMILYASAVFYPMDIIPEPFHQNLILNPLFWIIDQFRCYVYYGTFPHIIPIINSLLISSIILVIGIIIFKTFESRITMKF